MQLPGILVEVAGWLAFQFAIVQPMLPMYLHLIVSAVLPIYAGSYASLTRPTSAAKRKKSKKDADDTDDEDAEDAEHRMEGLSPTDAIMFPVMAGITLTSLYFIIQWLQDPALLNKILGWYFATFGVFAVSRLCSDGLDVFHSILFPREYAFKGVLYTVDAKSKEAVPIASAAVRKKSSPLPGILSYLPLPQSLQSVAWFFHSLPNRKISIRGHIHGIITGKLKLGIHGIEGLVFGLTSVLWFTFVSKPWWLTNIMGFGFAYSTLQILSPTTFATGSLILGGLFFYDIYFVFFTPMMVTVAKSLDIPVKLLFPRPADPGAAPGDPRPLSMLGLGDIVLPGIMIGLALRFDLYMYYLRLQKRVQSSSTTEATEQPSKEVISGDKPDPDTTTQDVSNIEVVKAPYFSGAYYWGERLWTVNFHQRSLLRFGARYSFPKPYFHASLVGYITGMVVTLGVMQIFNHAQPALLYLVPGVLLSIWITAALRREIKELWDFSDAAEDESSKSDDKTTEDAKSETGKTANNDTQKSKGEQSDGRKSQHSQKSIFSLERSDERMARYEKAAGEAEEDATRDEDKSGTDTDIELVSKTKNNSKASKSSKAELKKQAKELRERKIVYFSITLPPPLRSRTNEQEQNGEEKSTSARSTTRAGDDAQESASSEQGGTSSASHNWRATANEEEGDDAHALKKVRVG